MIEAAVDVAFEAWALAIEAVTDRFGRLAGLAIFFLPWIVIALTIWLIVFVVG